MTDAKTEDSKPDVIPPAETDERAFDAIMRIVAYSGVSEVVHRLLKSPALFDPAQARANAKAIATALRKVANELCDATRPAGQPRVRELYSIHGEASGVWFCEKCRYTARSEAEALSCCSARFCEKCGTQYRDRSYTCEPCWSAKQVEKAAAVWSEADPIDVSDYTGAMIYVETEDGHPYSSGDGYFGSVEELVDEIDSDFDGDPPTFYVYATRPTKMSWSAEDEIDHVLERLDFHDGARDEISAEAEKELQTYLDGWVDKYSPTVYFPDYSKKIVGWEAWLSPAEKESSDAEQE